MTFIRYRQPFCCSANKQLALLSCQPRLLVEAQVTVLDRDAVLGFFAFNVALLVGLTP